MDATPYIDLIQRPNDKCPESKQEQSIVNKHPDATIIVTVSEVDRTLAKTLNITAKQV